jgi:hypothetical protein
MSYIALDLLTQECVGPFDTEDQALAFSMEASDWLNERGLVFDIHQACSPTEWFLNNTSKLVEEADDGNSVEEDRSNAVLSPSS